MSLAPKRKLTRYPDNLKVQPFFKDQLVSYDPIYYGLNVYPNRDFSLWLEEEAAVVNPTSRPCLRLRLVLNLINTKEYVRCNI